MPDSRSFPSLHRSRGSHDALSNHRVPRFIPQVVNPRCILLLAGLCTAVLPGQTAAPSQASRPAAGSSGTRGGAAPTRATGLPPTAPGLSGDATPGSSSGTPAGNSGSGTPASNTGNTGRAGSGGANGAGGNSGAGGGNGNQTSAPAATGNVEVTGRPAQNGIATVDQPLLPIVTSGNALGIRSGTPIAVKLGGTVESGHSRQGDIVSGTLAAPIAGLPIGTPVRLTVVESSPAGRLYSFGELSLQVVSIADHRVLSDIVTAQGKEGPKELPDAAPARGTEAIFNAGQLITLPAS